MNNSIFENSTKVYFGRGCVKEYLACLAGKKTDLMEIANSCTVISRGYKRMAHQEILEILQECGM